MRIKYILLQFSNICGPWELHTLPISASRLVCNLLLFTFYLPSGLNSIPVSLVISYIDNLIIMLTPTFNQGISSEYKFISNISSVYSQARHSFDLLSALHGIVFPPLCIQSVHVF